MKFEDSRSLQEPVISVILISGPRKSYILKALESLISQTLERHLFEIVTIKGFLDDGIDKFLAARSDKLLTTTNLSFSEQISLALGHCHGKILTVLDDDDEFEPHRLERICEVFNKFGSPLLYYNRRSLIDANGFKLKSWHLRYLRGSRFGLPRTYTTTDYDHIDFPRFTNDSSISINTCLLREMQEELIEVGALFDLFLLGIAAGKGIPLFFDNLVLTKYRVHGDQNSPFAHSVSHRMKKTALNSRSGFDKDSATLDTDYDLPLRRLRIIKELCGESSFAENFEFLIRHLYLSSVIYSTEGTDRRKLLSMAKSYLKLFGKGKKTHSFFLISLASLRLMSSRLPRLLAYQFRDQVF